YEYNSDVGAPVCTVGYKQCDGKFYSDDCRDELRLIEDPVFWQPIFAPDSPVYQGKYIQRKKC
ncbi:MAG: hypothetical protein LBH05_02380, partial [Deferribacteraceae bacterium]|nr:hypothetical protein [Deferribacteraceae bacterium]